MIMKVNPITLMIGLIFLYPLVKGFLFKFSSNALKLDISDVSRSVSFIISLIMGTYFGKKYLYSMMEEYMRKYII